jgi:nucleoside-diphosphate kinase
MAERTLIIVKPDGIQRHLAGQIIARFERRGFKLVAAKFMRISQKLGRRLYAIHKGKPFYAGLIQYITSAPVMAMVWEGPNAIAAVRQSMGSTRPTEAAPGSLRHDFALDIGRNLTHASDSLETGEKEVALWFKHDELVRWERDTDKWIFETNG